MDTKIEWGIGRRTALPQAALLFGSLLAAGTAHAAVYTYNQSVSNTAGTADQWSAGTSWSSTPITSGSDTTLVFGGTTLAATPTAAGTGTTIFTNNDLGTFVLNRLNITYTGVTSGGAEIAPTLTISGGALEFVNNGATTPLISASARYTGTVVRAQPVTTISNELRLAGGIQVDANSQISLTGTLTLLNDDVSRTLTLTGTHTGFGAPDTSTNNNVLSALTDISTISSRIGNVAGTGVTSIAKSGNGSWVLSGSNSYSGGSTVTAGTLIAAHSNALGSGDVIVSGSGEVVLSAASGTYANNISISGNGAFSMPGGVGRTPGALVVTNGANLTGTVTLTGSSRISAVAIYSNVTSTAGTISGRITGGYQLEFGPGGAQTGGTITLTNTGNDWSGGTRITAGGTSSGSTMAVALGASNVIPDTGILTLTSLDRAGSVTLRLNGNNETIGGLNSAGFLSATQVVENNHASAASTLTLGSNNGGGDTTALLRNGSTGKLNLTKIGTGTQTLGRAATYTGVTRIENGVLEVDFGGYAESSGTALTNYLSASSTLQLAGGTLRLKGRADGQTTSQTVNITAANPYSLSLPSVDGISVGQILTVDGVTPANNTYVRAISGTTLYFNFAQLTVTTGTHTIGTTAMAFTHTQTLASLDLSANSAIDFGADAAAITLTFNGVTQSVDGSVLTIDNWNGDRVNGGGLSQLRFTGADSSVFTNLFTQSEVAFTGYGTGYGVKSFGTYYEIVPVPEPAAVGLIGLGVLAFLRRRRNG